MPYIHTLSLISFPKPKGWLAIAEQSDDQGACQFAAPLTPEGHLYNEYTMDVFYYPLPLYTPAIVSQTTLKRTGKNTFETIVNDYTFKFTRRGVGAFPYKGGFVHEDLKSRLCELVPDYHDLMDTMYDTHRTIIMGCDPRKYIGWRELTAEETQDEQVVARLSE